MRESCGEGGVEVLRMGMDEVSLGMGEVSSGV